MGETDFLFSTCALIKKRLFFVDTQSGLPAIMNLKNGAVNYCELFQDYILRYGDSIDFMQEFDGNVYALETAGDYLVIFEWDKRQCSYISLNCNNRKWGNFVAFERCGSVFYIFPKYGNRIISFHAEDWNLTETTTVLDETEEIQCACSGKNRVWLLSQDGSRIYAYDLAENKGTVYKLNINMNECINGILINDSIYFLNMFGILYKWNVGDKEVLVINTMETQHLNAETMIKMVNAGNKLFVLPAFGSDIKMLNLDAGDMQIYNKYPADFSYHDIGWSKYYGHCEDEKYYYLAMRLGNYFLKICKSDGEFTWIKPKIINESDKDKLLDLLGMHNRLKTGVKIFYEKEGYLNDWLKYIPMGSGASNSNADIGRKIYNEWGKA